MTPELPATDHIAEFSKALEISLERVRILDTDVANAHIRLIQPIICSDGHNYLLRIFEEKNTNMDRTKLLIQYVIQQQKQQQSLYLSSRTIILTHAVARFVTATDADIIPFPETFQWDAHRFCDYKRWWSYIIRSMALITRLENEIPKTFAPQVNILARELGTAQSTIKKAVTSAFSTIIVEETVIQEERQFAQVDLPRNTTISPRITLKNLTALRHRLRHPILNRLMYLHRIKSD